MKSNEIISSLQDAAKSLQCNIVSVGANQYHVYTEAALRHSARLLTSKESGPVAEAVFASPILKCEVRENELRTSLCLHGIEGTADELLGLLTIALATHGQNGLILACGGVLGLHEADDDYNDTNRAIIRGMQLLYKHPIAGKFNAKSDDRAAVAAGELSPFTEMGEDICASEVRNFAVDFILPPPTQETEHAYAELAELLRYWNCSDDQKRILLDGELSWIKKRNGSEIDEIFQRIKSVGGIIFHWT